MRKLRLALVAGAATIVGLFSLPTAAFAVATTTITQVVSTPDDTVGSGPWARDTFERTTTVQSTDTGFKIQISDVGTFITPTGVKGTVTGHGTFVVTGGTYNSDHGMGGTINRSSVAAKDSFTGAWWKNFVDGGSSAGIEPWSWTYKSKCWDPKFVEVHTESSANGSAGERPSKVCPPEPTKSPTASPSPSKSPTVKPTVKPTPTKTPDSRDCAAYTYTGTTLTLCDRFPNGTEDSVDCKTVGYQVTLKDPKNDPWRLDGAYTVDDGHGCVTYPKHPAPTKAPTTKPTTAAPTTGNPTAEETTAAPILSGDNLPKTGPSLGLLIGAALMASGAGGALFYFTRRRKVNFTA